jgi:hypothetical protein
MHLEDYDH